VRNTTAGLLRACHFEACVAVTVIAVLLGIAVGGLSPARLLLGGAVLAGQLSIGWLNDVLDAGRDTIAGRTDKPIVAGLVGRGTVGVAAVVAAVCCVPLSLLLGLVPGVVHLVAVVSAWAYDVWLKSTVVSVAPFLLSFGLLPVFVVLSVPGVPVAWWLPVAGRCWAAARTSRTCCRTWPGTRPPVSVAYPIGWARPGAGGVRPYCCWRRPWCWSSDRSATPCHG